MEAVQRLGTRLFPELRGLSYVERCQRLDLFPLKYRRTRADLIFIYRVLVRHDYPELEGLFPRNEDARTRGHEWRIKITRTDNLPHVFRLSQRTIPLWNNLSSAAVNAPTIASFKAAIDRELYETS